MKKVKQQSKKLSKVPFFSWKFLILFFIFLFSTLAIFSSGTIESQDGWLYLNVSRNLYYHHEPTALPQTDYPFKNVNMNSMLGKDGKWYAPGSFGYSLAMVPAVALSDVLHHVFGSTPPQYFPLESDWTVLLFASFTNSFLIAITGIGILLYALELGQTRRQAVITALLTVFATYLFPLSKHAFAHPLFIASLVFCFYFIKRFANSREKKYLLFSAISFLVLYFSYNIAYLLALPPLYIYFVFALRPTEQKRILLATFITGVLAITLKPTLINLIFEYLKFMPKMMIESMVGFLFSSGKSLFLYSPLLFVLPFFWWKIRRALLPELITFLLLSAVFVYFYSKAFIIGSAGQVTPIWYGGQAWGVRYIGAIIPFLMLLVMECVFGMKRLQQYIIVGSLLLASIWVQLIGVSIPYILQYRDLPSTINVGKTELSYYDYASFIPRYSPLLTMSMEFVRKVKGFRETVDHGDFNVKFYDGFEVPIKTGNGFIRGFLEEGHITLKQEPGKPIQKLDIRFNNIPNVLNASASATVHISVNKTEVLQETLKPGIDTFLTIPLSESSFKDGENKIDMNVSFDSNTPQDYVLYITQMIINDQNVNLASLDYPDVSSSGVKTTPIPYQYFGKKMSDPWRMWYLRARINELTFDFWWIKNLYYWDRPQEFLWALFALNILVIGQSGYLLFRQLRKFGEK
jgi:hypothetical protein